ncbi:hypothetical protein [Microcoleus sp. FACHB-68]|uniref:hypothetical protein n=1 Tax=Microcoleus sp. FACHB-68 TaxID=2692826 RepID=UPI001687DF99|nr:hypothetical protein [Microcoleus sp. FACHB-68]MBD1938829.1 hypothetical protein [Microcoleus sp. FACHB-68]
MKFTKEPSLKIGNGRQVKEVALPGSEKCQSIALHPSLKPIAGIIRFSLERSNYSRQASPIPSYSRERTLLIKDKSSTPSRYNAFTINKHPNGTRPTQLKPPLSPSLMSLGIDTHVNHNQVAYRIACSHTTNKPFSPGAN